MRPSLVILCGLGLVLAAATVVALTAKPDRGSPGDTSESSAHRKYPDVGDLAVLRNGKMKEVNVGLSRVVHEHYWQSLAADDAFAVRELRREGRVWAVPAGTRCRVIERGQDTAEVRLIDDEHGGRIVFVSSISLHWPNRPHPAR